MRFEAHLHLLYSLVILLNDEQPDIRYYLCESPALSKVIDHNNLQPWKLLNDGYTVLLNDFYVLELVFSDFTARLSASSPHLLPLYLSDFLLRHWLLGNPYRDHLAKNFEDKIFFFEPINKFYDLLWVKRIAFRQALALARTLKPALGITGSDDIEGKVGEYFAAGNVMRQDSVTYEALA